MPGESFRFIHASDFHLDTPLGDLDELPPPLREQMATAPHSAVNAVFEAALSSSIDFLVLTGDLLSPQTAGPYGMNLLLRQFEKLAEADKAVYWATGLADAQGNWPEACAMPANVTIFGRDEPTPINVVRGGRTICRIVGRASDGRSSLHVPAFECDPSDELTIGVGYGEATIEMLAEARFDLWCLGGKHNRLELDADGELLALYCGSPQGRSLHESGAHGYSVIDVDAEGNVRSSDVDIDLFRYARVSLDAADIARVGSIENLLGEKIVRLQHEAGGRHLIIGWDIAADNEESLAALGSGDSLLEWVRREYGHGTPAAWSTSLRIRPPQKYPKSWYEEDTILGDYLRIAGEHRKAGSAAMNLLPMTEEHPELTTNTTTLLAEIPQGQQAEILDQATLLGVELLRGGKPDWMTKS